MAGIDGNPLRPLLHRLFPGSPRIGAAKTQLQRQDLSDKPINGDRGLMTRYFRQSILSSRQTAGTPSWRSLAAPRQHGQKLAGQGKTGNNRD
jgi:hypothetical protein